MWSVGENIIDTILGNANSNSEPRSSESLMKELLSNSTELISEVKRCNPKLLDFLRDNQQAILTIVEYITVEGPDPYDFERAYKLPSAADELLDCAPISLISQFFNESKHSMKAKKLNGCPCIKPNSGDQDEHYSDGGGDSLNNSVEVNSISSKDSVKESEAGTETAEKSREISDEAADQTQDQKKISTVKEENSEQLKTEKEKSSSSNVFDWPAMNKLFEFVLKQGDVNEVLAGYWSKLVKQLLDTRPQDTIEYILTSQGVLQGIFSKMNNNSMSSVVQSLLILESNKFNPQISEYLSQFSGIKLKAISEFIDKMETYSNEEVISLAAILKEVIQKYYLIQDGKEMLEFLASEESVEKLFKYFLHGKTDHCRMGGGLIIEQLTQYYQFNANSFIKGYPEGSEYYNIMLSQYEHMAFIQGMIKHSGELSQALEEENPNTKSFGPLRLKIVNIIGIGIRIFFPQLIAAFKQAKIMSKIMDAFFRYEWHNILHQQVLSMVLFIVDNADDSKPREYLLHLIEDVKLTDLIIKNTDDTLFYFDPANKTKTTTKGFLGYVIQIADALEKFYKKERLKVEKQQAVTATSTTAVTESTLSVSASEVTDTTSIAGTAAPSLEESSNMPSAVISSESLIAWRNGPWMQFVSRKIDAHKEKGCRDLGQFDDFLNGKIPHPVIATPGEDDMSIYNEYERQQAAERYKQRPGYVASLELMKEYKEKAASQDGSQAEVEIERIQDFIPGVSDAQPKGDEDGQGQDGDARQGTERSSTKGKNTSSSSKSNVKFVQMSSKQLDDDMYEDFELDGAANNKAAEVATAGEVSAKKEPLNNDENNHHTHENHEEGHSHTRKRGDSLRGSIYSAAPAEKDTSIEQHAGIISKEPKAEPIQEQEQTTPEQQNPHLKEFHQYPLATSSHSDYYSDNPLIIEIMQKFNQQQKENEEKMKEQEEKDKERTSFGQNNQEGGFAEETKKLEDNQVQDDPVDKAVKVVQELIDEGVNEKKSDTDGNKNQVIVDEKQEEIIHDEQKVQEKEEEQHNNQESQPISEGVRQQPIESSGKVALNPIDDSPQKPSEHPINETLESEEIQNNSNNLLDNNHRLNKFQQPSLHPSSERIIRADDNNSEEKDTNKRKDINSSRSYSPGNAISRYSPQKQIYEREFGKNSESLVLQGIQGKADAEGKNINLGIDRNVAVVSGESQLIKGETLPFLGGYPLKGKEQHPIIENKELKLDQAESIPKDSIPSGQTAAISTKKESNAELADHVIKAEKADYKTVVFAEEETNNFEPINIEIEPEKDEDSGIIQDAAAKSTSQGQKAPEDKLKGTTLDAKKEQENNKVNKDTQSSKGALKDESISPVGVDSTAPKAQDLAIKVSSPEKKNQVSEANTISPVPPHKEDLSIPTSKSPVSSSSPSQGNSNPSSSSQLQNVNQPASVNDPSVLPKISLSPMSANSNKNAISPNNLQQPSPSSSYSNNTFSPANVQPLIQLQQPSPSSKPQIETQPFSLSPSQQIVQPSPSSQSNSKNLIENTTPSSGTAELSGAGVNSFTQQVRQQQSSGSSSSLPVESSLTPPISPLNSLSQPNSNKNSLVGPDPAEQIQKAVQSSTQAPTSAPSPSTITQQTPEIPKSEANPSQPPKPLLIDLSKATETASAQQTSEQQQPPQKHSPFKLPETSASVWQFPSSTFVPAYIPSSKSTHEKPNQYSENQTVEEYQAYKPTMFAMTPNNKSNPTFGENDNNFQNLAKAVEIDHRKASLRYSYDPYSLNLLKEKQAAEASAANPHGVSHDKTVDDSSSSSAPGSEMKSAAERFGIKSLMKSPQEEQSLNKFVLKETIVKQSAFARKLRYGEDNEEENDDEVQVGPQRSSMPAKLMKEGSKDENKVNLSEYAKLSKSSPLSFKNKFSENLHSSQEVQNNQQGVGAQKQGISSFGISEETTSKQASTGAPVESAQSSDSLKLQEKSNSNPSPTSSISAYAPQPAAKSLDEKSLVEKYSNPSGYPASSSQLNEQMIRSPQFGPQSSTLPLSNAAQSPSLQYSSNNSYKPIVSPAQSASSSSALNAPPSVVAPAISKEEKYSYSEKEATLLKSKLDSSKDYNELLNHIRDFQNVFGILNQNNIELIEERILTSVELRQNFLEVAEKNGCQLETTLTSLEQDKQRQEQELKLQYQTEFEMIERQTKLESDEAKAKKKFTEFIGKLIGDRVNQLYDINFKYSMLQKQSLEKSIIEAKILNDRLRSMNFVVPNITTSQIVREQTAATTMFQQQQEQTRGAANNNNTLSTSTGLKQQQGSSLQNRSQQQQLTPASPVLTVSASRKHKGSDAFDDEYEHASPCFGSNDLGIPLTQEQNWDQSKDTAQGKSAGDSSPSFGNAMINSYKIQQSPSRSSRHNSYSQRSMHSSQRKNSTSTTEEGAGTTNNPATDDPYDFKASSSARDKSPMPNQTPAFMGSSNSAMFNMTSSTNSSGSGSSSDYVRRLTSNTTLPMQRQHQASPPRRATLPSNTMMTKAAGGNEQQQIQQSLGHYQYGQQHHNANINTSQPLPAHGYPAQQKQPHSVPQQPQVQPMRSAETLQQLPVQVPVTQQQQQHRKIFAQNPPPNMPAIVSKQQQQNPTQQQQLGTLAAVVYPGQPQQPLSNLAEEQYKKLQDDQYKQLSDNLKIPSFQSSNPPPPSSQSSSYTSAQFQQQQQQSLLQLQQQQLLIAKQQQQQLLAQQQQQLQPQQQPPQLQQPYQYTKPPGIPSQQYPPNATALPIQQNTQLPPPPANYSAVSSRYPSKPSLISSQQPTLQQPQQQQQQGGSVRTIQIDLSKEEQQAQALGMPTLKNTASAINLTNPASKPPLQSQYNSVGGDYESNNNINVRSHQQQQYLGLPQQERTKPLSNSTYFDDQLQFRGMNHHNNRPLSTSDIMGQQQPQLQPKDQSYQPESSFAKPSYPPMMAPQTQQGYLPSNVSTNTLSAQQLNASNPASSQILNQDVQDIIKKYTSGRSTEQIIKQTSEQVQLLTNNASSNNLAAKSGSNPAYGYNSLPGITQQQQWSSTAQQYTGDSSTGYGNTSGGIGTTLGAGNYKNVITAYSQYSSGSYFTPSIPETSSQDYYNYQQQNYEDRSSSSSGNNNNNSSTSLNSSTSSQLQQLPLDTSTSSMQSQQGKKIKIVMKKQSNSHSSNNNSSSDASEYLKNAAQQQQQQSQQMISARVQPQQYLQYTPSELQQQQTTQLIFSTAGEADLNYSQQQQHMNMKKARQIDQKDKDFLSMIGKNPKMN